MINKVTSTIGGEILLVILTIFATSCSQDNAPGPPSNEENLRELYEHLMSIQTVSVFAHTPDSRADYNNTIRPILSKSDLEYLSSLSQKEMELLRDSLLNVIGGEDGLNTLTSGNYYRIFNNVGGYDGMNQLEDFSTAYLTSSQGWEKIQSLMPKDLSEDVQKIYMGQAAFIDQFGRPLYDELVMHVYWDNSMQIAKEDTNDHCRIKLSFDLFCLGCTFGAGLFLEAMSAGTLTELDSCALYAEFIRIWYEYEICNLRWH